MLYAFIVKLLWISRFLVKELVRTYFSFAIFIYHVFIKNNKAACVRLARVQK